MHRYSVSVALFDFLPVAFTAMALVLLARAIAARHTALAPIAWAAAVLVPFGGACKASWKLIVALTGQDIGWLENLLFIAMAPGFVAMAYCLHQARRAWQLGMAASSAPYSPLMLALWLALPLVGALAAALLKPESRLWFFWLLGITTIANATLIAQALLACRFAGLRAPMLCFAYNFLATLALSGLSRLPAGEMTAWIQEGVNLSAQAALCLGTFHLSRRMLEPRP